MALTLPSQRLAAGALRPSQLTQRHAVGKSNNCSSISPGHARVQHLLAPGPRLVVIPKARKSVGGDPGTGPLKPLPPKAWIKQALAPPTAPPPIPAAHTPPPSAAVKRPPTAYRLFATEKMPELRSMALVGQAWHELSDAEKKPYAELAEAGKPLGESKAAKSERAAAKKLEKKLGEHLDPNQFANISTWFHKTEYTRLMKATLEHGLPMTAPQITNLAWYNWSSYSEDQKADMKDAWLKACTTATSPAPAKAAPAKPAAAPAPATPAPPPPPAAVVKAVPAKAKAASSAPAAAPSMKAAVVAAPLVAAAAAGVAAAPAAAKMQAAEAAAKAAEAQREANAAKQMAAAADAAYKGEAADEYEDEDWEDEADEEEEQEWEEDGNWEEQSEGAEGVQGPELHT